MFKKLLIAAALAIASIGFAFAQVDVNHADQAALDGVKGIGPVMSKTIIEERKKGGDFKDWVDFEKRVKGIGDKNSVKLSEAGLVVNGKAKANAPAAKSTGKASKTATKVDAKADAKTDVKAADAKPEAKADAKADAKASKAAAKAAKADAKAAKKADAAKAAPASTDVKK